MRSGLKRTTALLLTLALISMSALNVFLAKYAQTFSVTDSLRVAFFLNNTVNMPRGREMNTLFHEDTVKIVFGATTSDLPSGAKLIDPAVMSGYTMVSNTGQTNGALSYVTGVTPAAFDPTDSTTYGSYRINSPSDDMGLFAFYDEDSNTTYLVSAVSSVTYHFHEESDPDPLGAGSTNEYNDFFYGLASLEDIELKTGASWDTSDVKTFSNFLKGCEAIDNTELAQIISWIDPSSAYSLAGMFQGMTSVTSVDISDWDLSRAAGVDISYMLCGMTNLTAVDFPGGANKISLLAGNGIKSLFAQDTSLQYLDLSDLPYCETTNDTAAFNGCSSLMTIIVAQDFVHSTIEPGASIFEGCTSLIGQAGTAYSDEYLSDPTAAVGKSYAYVDGRIVDGVRHYGYYSDGAALCTLTFDANGGVSGSTTEIREFTGTTVTIPASSAPTRGLDIFLGWGLTDSASVPVYVTGDTLTLNNNTTLYAIYEVTVHLRVGEELRDLIPTTTKHIVYCLETELPDGIGAPLGTADMGGTGEIKVYHKNDTTYIAACVDARRVVFEFNENSEALYEEKTLLETISHTDSVRIDTSGVTRFRNMFKNCTSLQENSLNAFLAEFDTSSAIQFNAMFSNVRVSYLDISSFDTSNVTDFSWMFQDMANLTEINFGPYWDVSSADNRDLSYLSGQSGRNRRGFNNMFERCTSLTELDLSGWNLNQTSVVAATSMFNGCRNLTTIYTDGSFDWTRLASNATNMFTGCTSLVGGNGTRYNSSHLDRTYARLDTDSTPGYFTDIAVASNARITFDAFGGTAGLSDHASGVIGTTITLTSDYTPTPPAGHTFAGWSLTPGGLPVLYEEGDTMTITGNTLLYAVYTNDTPITSVTLKTGQAIASLIRNSTTDIVFGKMEDLPAHVTYEGIADDGNTGAVKVYYEGNTAYFIVDSFEPSVTINFNANSDGMFLSKTNVETISHTSGVSINTSNVTTFRDMFKQCTSLEETSLNTFISNFDTSSAVQFNAMFSEVGAVNLDLSSFDTSNVTDFSYMFENMKSLKTITFGSGWDVSSADNNTLAQGRQRCGFHAMFFGCSDLEEIDISGWTLNTTSPVNAGEMFSGCTSLRTIYADSSFDNSRIEGSNKDKDMFKNCTSLVGGAGTVFNSSHTDKAYAIIDGAPDNPGYFTDVSTRSRSLSKGQINGELFELINTFNNLSEEDRAKLVEKYGEIDIETLQDMDEKDLELLKEELGISSEEENKKEEKKEEEKKEEKEQKEESKGSPEKDTDKEKTEETKDEKDSKQGTEQSGGKESSAEGKAQEQKEEKTGETEGQDTEKSEEPENDGEKPEDENKQDENAGEGSKTENNEGTDGQDNENAEEPENDGKTGGEEPEDVNKQEESKQEENTAESGESSGAEENGDSNGSEGDGSSAVGSILLDLSLPAPMTSASGTRRRSKQEL